MQVNEALRKFSLDAVLGGLSSQKQTITVGSTIKEEQMDSGKAEVSFHGYVCVQAHTLGTLHCTGGKSYAVGRILMLPATDDIAGTVDTLDTSE